MPIDTLVRIANKLLAPSWSVLIVVECLDIPLYYST